MQVFKFGGASVKNAQAIQNVASILKSYQGHSLFVVVSAMDKTTNALEQVVNAYEQGQKQEALAHLEQVKQFHHQVIQDLNLVSPQLEQNLANIYAHINAFLANPTSGRYDFDYDQVVSCGELISTHIISAYLNQQGINNTWLDARRVIATNERYREGRIKWDKTTEQLTQNASQPEALYITQGFIGSAPDGTTTTLGREGSDFTAAIMAYVLNAESVTIWKDVPGVLNADPKLFPNTVKLDQISYEEAIELTYFGASVIHPRTIQPLQNKNIPLYVRSFKDYTATGTVISKASKMGFLIPCFIVKMRQTLLALSPLDFSFIAEDHLKDIFTYFTKYGIKINLMQNSAITFWACFDTDERKLKSLVEDLSKTFSVSIQSSLELVTIRHYNESTVQQTMQGKKVLLEQKGKETIRLVCVTHPPLH